VAATLGYLAFWSVSGPLMALSPSATFVGLPVLLALWAVARRITRVSGLGPAQLGLTRPTTTQWVRATAWTLPLLVGLVVVKAGLLATGAFPGERLFDLGRHHAHMSTAQLLVVGGLYTVLAPVQEFIARSGIQAPLLQHPRTAHPGLWAGSVAALLYAGSHLHVSAALALAVLPLGLYWGAMFHQERNLYTVAASHVLVGHVGFLVVGFDGILR